MHAQFFLRNPRAQANAGCRNHRLRRAVLTNDFVKPGYVRKHHSLGNAFERFGGMPEPRIGDDFLAFAQRAHGNELRPDARI
jgi:hypothetical protein